MPKFKHEKLHLGLHITVKLIRREITGKTKQMVKIGC